MLLNYLVTAWRRLRKHKGFFTLNFFGLYISVTASLLIALLVFYEAGFDRNASKGLQVFRVIHESTNDKGEAFNAVTAYPLARALRVAMPGEQDIAQIHYEREVSVLIGDQVLKEHGVVFADSVFPRLFPLESISGSLARVLSEPGFVALTESTAKRYFGTGEVVGRRLKLNRNLDLQVAAVVADAPANSHLPYHLLVSYSSLTKDFIGGFPLDQWTLSVSGYTYIGLREPVNVARTELILADLVKKNIQPQERHGKTHYKLQPLAEIHYDTRFASSNPGSTTARSYLYLVGAIGLFLILAACINYTNLSTALALKQSKEVGIRKTLGATRRQLIRQLLSEAFLLTGIVILAAGASIRLFLPLMNQFLQKEIPLHWLTPASGAFLLVLWAVVALLSGLYPAAVLSGFRPVTALKSRVFTPGASVLNLRRGLVVFQFMTAQMLIICAVIVSKQMNYMRSTPMGFNKDLVVDISLPSNKLPELRAFRSRLTDIPGVNRVSLSLGAPITDNRVNTGFNLRERYKEKQFEVAVKAADHDYLPIYGLQLVAGRWFEETDDLQVETAVEAKLADSLKHYAFVLNETAVKTLGFRSPQEAIGRYVTFGMNDISAPVIGVVKDYHIASLHNAVSPVLMVPFPFFYYNAGIRLAGGYSSTTMAAIEKAFTATYPHQLFEARFLDQAVAELYAEEQRTQTLFSFFTGLSIAINVLGLIGLLSFMIEQKTREVGIRKVLGASIGDISYLLSKDFLRLSCVAFLIAAPAAGLLMDRWLRDFAYRTAFSWWVFVASLAATLVITALAISFQTVRAAVVNPVRSLRSE